MLHVRSRFENRIHIHHQKIHCTIYIIDIVISHSLKVIVFLISLLTEERATTKIKITINFYVCISNLTKRRTEKEEEEGKKRNLPLISIFL